MAAFRADLEVVFEFFGVDKLAAFGTLGPEAVAGRGWGTVVLKLDGAKLVAAMKDPAHCLPLLSRGGESSAPDPAGARRMPSTSRARIRRAYATMATRIKGRRTARILRINQEKIVLGLMLL